MCCFLFLWRKWWYQRIPVIVGIVKIFLWVFRSCYEYDYPHLAMLHILVLHSMVCVWLKDLENRDKQIIAAIKTDAMHERYKCVLPRKGSDLCVSSKRLIRSSTIFCSLENAAEGLSVSINLNLDNFTSALASSNGSLENFMALSSAAFSDAAEYRFIR